MATEADPTDAQLLEAAKRATPDSPGWAQAEDDLYALLSPSVVTRPIERAQRETVARALLLQVQREVSISSGLELDIRAWLRASLEAAKVSP